MNKNNTNNTNNNVFHGSNDSDDVVLTLLPVSHLGSTDGARQSRFPPKENRQEMLLRTSGRISVSDHACKNCAVSTLCNYFVENSMNFERSHNSKMALDSSTCLRNSK